MIFRNTIYNNYEMREAFRKWLIQQDFNYFCTANFNCKTNFATAKKQLSKWANYTDCKILERRYKYATASQRIHFIAIPEHSDSNLHYHMVMRAPVKPLKAIKIAQKQWKRIVPAGDLWVESIDSQGDLDRIAIYITKDFWDGIGFDEFITSD